MEIVTPDMIKFTADKIGSEGRVSVYEKMIIFILRLRTF
jgi:hypothetical protein